MQTLWPIVCRHCNASWPNILQPKGMPERTEKRVAAP